MSEIYTEKGWSFLILEALRTAAKEFYKNAPKDETAQREQDGRLQRDQETVWYDPDLTAPLFDFAFSRQWGERFRLLESGVRPGDVLAEVQQEIEQKDLRVAIMNALNCWDEERKKNREEKELPEYSLEYVRAH